MSAEQHLVITDSGLGGLSVCALLERLLRERGGPAGVRLTYVNAWPDEGVGFNDLPDTGARVAVFDRALAAMEAMAPDRIAIACNTLSILYEHTAHGRHGVRREDPNPRLRTELTAGDWQLSPRRPVGIIETAVDLFLETLAADPDGALVILGTKTTIESGVYTARLIASGIDRERIAAVSCHGLAGAIETDPDSARVNELIDACTTQAAAAAPGRGGLHVGLCCTHYTYVRDRLRAVLERHSGRRVDTLDPNARMAEALHTGLKPCAATERGGAALEERRAATEGGGAALEERRAATEGPPAAAEGAVHPLASGAAGGVTIRVISKVSLDAKRHAFARLLAPISPLTAAALLEYTHEPRLF